MQRCTNGWGAAKDSVHDLPYAPSGYVAGEMILKKESCGNMPQLSLYYEELSLKREATEGGRRSIVRASLEPERAVGEYPKRKAVAVCYCNGFKNGAEGGRKKNSP